MYGWDTLRGMSFKRVPLKFHIKYLIRILDDAFLLQYNVENLRALKLKRPCAFLEAPPKPILQTVYEWWN